MKKAAVKLQHNACQMAYIITAVVSLVLTVLFNGLANEDFIPGLFVSSIDAVSDKYYLNITPAGWTFTIWAFIYIAQFLFMAYSLSLICRKGPKNYLYLSPKGMIPNIVFICYSIGNIGNIAWVFLWDREFIVASGIVIALIAVMLVVAAGFSVKGSSDSIPDLQAAGLDKEIWLNRILVQNSIAMYATWVSIATLLNLAMVLCYVLGVPENDASTVSLGILCFDLTTWFLVDMFVVYRHSNYVIIPYTVVITALSGSIDKNFVAWSRNSLFSVILLVIGVAMFLIKIVIMLWRHCNADDDDDEDKDSEK